ncbi:uncharacterized protein LDX57_004545 [Aspergillus melleus]|uniref:uncharacterized protein n=1 Tax=Aspergillus melleus TaxID=138277 RepID=UPI001E8E04ED|nr:uncharacterized protein LDX57_004545 [Aspergillus melleus]KAH8426815.1 hypothetical protein LDX57_004545 [Aspergillus melleus]
MIRGLVKHLRPGFITECPFNQVMILRYIESGCLLYNRQKTVQAISTKRYTTPTKFYSTSPATAPLHCFRQARGRTQLIGRHRSSKPVDNCRFRYEWAIRLDAGPASKLVESDGQMSGEIILSHLRSA